MAGAGGARGLREGPGQPVVVRALSLLEQFTERRRALSLSELARLAGLAPATALRLVRHLTEWGALERLEDGRYVVGVRLWEIASLSPRGHGVRQIALPYLEDLYEVTRHHVLLSVREGRDAVLIDRLSSRHATEVAYRVGGRMPLRTTAVGQVLLAYSAPDVLEELLAQPAGAEQGAEQGTEPEAERGAGELSAADLRAVLAGVKQSGAAVVRRTQPSRTVSVAAPIYSAGGDVLAALSIVVPDAVTPAHELVPLVRAAARAISRSLGHQPTASGAWRHPSREAGALPA
ncbi:IclR family transcriptional regulator [Arthrobacter sp. W4I7]|uniref:IclR family transcriptional regulator n=1 Tax=Arthrobacter sp. W4I7 TaxID=3042296 RepID=UPI00277FDB57|nr:IclR family transcriptional regulator [Arthrobacter sp. W4I7]MDQ0689304.1 DNA-binding IclR family transcriptional regulator [Arthrobacter sp. W4I7]